MSFESYEADGYMHNLDMWLILHKLHVPYLTRSRCREKVFELGTSSLSSIQDKYCTGQHGPLT